MEEILKLMEQGDNEGAAELIMQTIDAGGFNDQIAVLAATVNFNFGDAETAKEFIMAGLDYNNKNYELYYMLGEYYSQNDANRALNCFEKAVDCANGASPEDYKLLTEKRDVYRKKCGTAPSYYSNARLDLISLIERNSDEEIHVLEVGCGTGSTLEAIKAAYPNAIVKGIEIVSEVAAEGAKKMDIICGNIETMDLPYENNYFDYVIFGDVIEHLTYPEIVLIRLKEYLRKGGCIISSIPNLMNAEVIYNLLRGNFTYQEAGIRDKTHLRFFTYSEIVNMFERCGYDVLDTRMTSYQGADTNSFGDFFDKLLAIDGVADRMYFDAFQYLSIARKRD